MNAIEKPSKIMKNIKISIFDILIYHEFSKISFTKGLRIINWMIKAKNNLEQKSRKKVPLEIM